MHPAKSDAACKVVITLVRETEEEDTYEFLNVLVPYDRILLIKPGTIHSDSLTEGEMAITVISDPKEVHADTVYLRMSEGGFLVGVGAAVSPRSGVKLGFTPSGLLRRRLTALRVSARRAHATGISDHLLRCRRA